MHNFLHNTEHIIEIYSTHCEINMQMCTFAETNMDQDSRKGRKKYNLK